jgi:hypothetical protein
MSEKDSKKVGVVLREWISTPPNWEDEGIKSPSEDILRLAIKLAPFLYPEPMRVLPDGEGGVIFEHRADKLFTTWIISSTGKIKYEQFYLS